MRIVRLLFAFAFAVFMFSCGGDDGGGGGVDAAAPDAAAPACDQPGEMMCGADCVDTSSDEQHCNGCDNPCGANQTCEGGVCACMSPNITCGTDCIDPGTDEANCGGCVQAGNGVECQLGVECISGICQPCLAPGVDCGNECANLESSELNCGACGNECVPGGMCTTATTGVPHCECADPNQVMCPDGCTFTATDENNCGGCGNQCGPGAVCISGGCACEAPGLQFCPGDGCFDLTVDNDHCGTCGNNCFDGLESCMTGTCGGDLGTCAPGVSYCPAIGGGNGCVDILDSPTNCGTTCAAADGNNCNGDEVCSGGNCECRPGYVDFAGNCINTLTNATLCGPVGGPYVNCAGDRCEDGACIPDACQVPGRVDCTGVGFVEDGTCVDRQTDNRHCGACDNPCAEDEVCVEGNCEAYQPTGDCTACPCSRCDEAFGGSACCDYAGAPVCVDADACP